MSQTISMNADTKKNVTLVLTWGIEAWIKDEANKRRISNAEFAREVFDKAMRESQGETKEVA